MLEIFTSHFEESNVVATGYLIARKGMVLQQQCQVAVKGLPVGLLDAQYQTAKLALDARLRLASNEQTFLYCEREIFDELILAKPAANHQSFAETLGLMSVFEPAILPVLARDVKYQRDLDSVVEKLLSEHRSLKMNLPLIQPDDELARVVKLLRTIYGQDDVEKLAEMLIFSSI